MEFVTSPAGEEVDNMANRIWNGDDPIAFSKNLLSISTTLYPQIRDLQKQIYEEELRAAIKKRRGKTLFDPGEYVLVATLQASTLDYRWNGPFQVVEKESENMYRIKNLDPGIDEVTRVPVSRLCSYDVGEMTDDEIKSVAVFPKLVCEKVLDFRTENNTLYFFAKWAGVPLQDPRDSDSWLSWAECRFCPPIREFCRANGIRPRLRLDQADA